MTGKPRKRIGQQDASLNRSKSLVLIFQQTFNRENKKSSDHFKDIENTVQQSSPHQLLKIIVDDEDTMHQAPQKELLTLIGGMNQKFKQQVTSFRQQKSAHRKHQTGFTQED